MKVVTWNVEWTNSRSPAADLIRQRIFAEDPEIACLTEAPADFLEGRGYVVEAEADYGYPIRGNRRKVLLWSKEPWAEVDPVGDAELPAGRFIKGVTASSLGDLTIYGICVPWAGAHVSTGRKDRERWADHLTFLEVFGRLAKDEDAVIVLGDFNQMIPRRTAPIRVFEALENAILKDLAVPTAGLVEPLGQLAIDHIAHTRDLRATLVKSLSPIGPRGEELSDHFGLAVELRAMTLECQKSTWGGSE